MTFRRALVTAGWLFSHANYADPSRKNVIARLRQYAHWAAAVDNDRCLDYSEFPTE